MICCCKLFGDDGVGKGEGVPAAEIPRFGILAWVALAQEKKCWQGSWVVDSFIANKLSAWTLTC